MRLRRQLGLAQMRNRLDDAYWWAVEGWRFPPFLGVPTSSGPGGMFTHESQIDYEFFYLPAHICSDKKIATSQDHHDFR